MSETNRDVTPWDPQWDLSTIPDRLFFSEYGRRNGKRGGRRPILLPCMQCGTRLSARERRKPCPVCGIGNRKNCAK